MSRLKGLPRSRVYRLIRSGEVRVNGGRARPATRLVPGDEVRVPPVQLEAEAADLPARPGQLEWIRRLVCHEDEDLLVLDKPAGLAVHGGSGIRLGAIELLRKAIPHGGSLELVHRLDRETSGCLLVARRRSSLRRLHQQFRDGSIDKRYLALLTGGDFSSDSLVCAAPLRTSERRGGERHVQVDPEGKPARTEFQLLRRYPGAALADVRLLTGRTHQIRVHAAALGHPLAGDPRYGRADDPIVHHAGLSRLFLHAASLSFEHPRDGRLVTVRCPLPEELAAVLGRLDG
ncbi:MAG: RluA family pseudouridine synthase [Chromatiales bacterium]|nr:RluA family pseudouridine synthase [Chromatiales bacterium]